MKFNNLLAALLLFLTVFMNAQMDDKFYQPGKEMKPMDFARKELIKLTAETDTITAYLLQPSVKKPKATVLFFHGAAGNVSTYQYITKPLVDDGYQVVMMDFRGYGQSTGTPTHQNVAADGQQFLDYFLNRPEVKNTRIFLFGSSLGSQVATHLARNNKDKISALIIDGGMSSFADIATRFAPQYKDFLRQMLKDVYTAKEDIKYTEGLPKLLIYSKNDETVPFTQGEEIYKNAPEPRVFKETQSGHIQSLKEETKEILEAINRL